MGVGVFKLPSLQQAWGTQYYGTCILAAFAYDVSNAMLYTIYPTQNYDVFLGVPLSIAQQLSVANRQLGGSYQNPNIPDPDVVYKVGILNVNPATVLDTPASVEIVIPAGLLLTVNQETETPHFPQCLLCEDGGPIITESGDYMVVR